MTVGALVLQLLVKRYFDWLYWLVVVMVSVFGTMIADVLHIGFGVPYAVSTPMFAAVLAMIFALWRTSERTLSIHSITSRRRELFYWATVIATFALGTAAGDMTATTFRLGYLASGMLFAALFAVPALAYWGLRLNPTVAFWTATPSPDRWVPHSPTGSAYRPRVADLTPAQERHQSSPRIGHRGVGRLSRAAKGVNRQGSRRRPAL